MKTRTFSADWKALEGNPLEFRGKVFAGLTVLDGRQETAVRAAHRKHGAQRNIVYFFVRSNEKKKRPMSSFSGSESAAAKTIS